MPGDDWEAFAKRIEPRVVARVMARAAGGRRRWRGRMRARNYAASFRESPGRWPRGARVEVRKQPGPWYRRVWRLRLLSDVRYWGVALSRGDGRTRAVYDRVQRSALAVFRRRLPDAVNDSWRKHFQG